MALGPSHLVVGTNTMARFYSCSDNKGNQLFFYSVFLLSHICFVGFCFFFGGGRGSEGLQFLALSKFL